MATHDHNLIGILPADDFTDHVVGVDVGKLLRLHLQQHLDPLAARLHALHHVGVFDGDRGVGDLRRLGVVAHLAGVRCTHRERCDRSDQARHRSGACGRHGAHYPIGDGLAVAGERRVQKDDAASSLVFSGLKLLKAADHQDLGPDPLGRCSHAATEPQHRQLGAARRHQLQRLVSTHPFRNQHRLAPNIFQPILPHPLQDPVDGAFQVLRAAEAVAEAVCQLGQALVGEAVGQRGVDEAIGDLPVALLNRGRLRRQLRQGAARQPQRDAAEENYPGDDAGGAYRHRLLMVEE